MADFIYSVPPEVLLERYGVSAQRVFGSSQPVASGIRASSPLCSRGHSASSHRPSRGHSASSPRSRPLAPAVTAPLPADQRWQGGASSSTNFPQTGGELGEDVGEAETGAEVPGTVRTLSLHELRCIILAPDKKRPLQGRKLHSVPSRSLSKKSNRNFHLLSEDAAGADACGFSRRSTALTEQIAAVRRAAADESRARARSPLRKLRAQAKDSPRPHSTASEGGPGSGASAGSAEADVEFDREDDEGSLQDWSGGVESADVGHGKARHKKGKHGTNPFVEFEDREIRLNSERKWLQDDEDYMRERFKGIKHGSVQARMDRGCMTRDTLYEDVVYFGTYSCRLNDHKQKKAELHRQSTPNLPPVRPPTSTAGAAIENMEVQLRSKNKVEHHAKQKQAGARQKCEDAKNKTSQGVKAQPTRSASKILQNKISLQSMAVVLEESSRTFAS